MQEAVRRDSPITAYGEAYQSDINRLREEFNMSPLDFKPRGCLRCDKQFLSLGPSHRMCTDCRIAALNYEPEVSFTKP